MKDIVKPTILKKHLDVLSKAALILIIKNTERHMTNMINAHHELSWRGPSPSQASHMAQQKATEELHSYLKGLVSHEVFPGGIPIVGSHQFAVDLRTTPTGPVALIDGDWWSVNGNEREIVDLRYKLSERQCKDTVVMVSGVGGKMNLIELKRFKLS